MAYPHNFYRLTWGGSTYTDEDIWTNTINLAAPAQPLTPPQEFTPADLVSIGAAIQGWFSSTANGISTAASLEWFKVAIIGPNGDYVLDAVLYDYPTTVFGPNTTRVETQRSLAVSFKTAKRRGPGSNGRIYIPMFAIATANTGRITTAQQNAIGTAGVTLITNLRGIFDGYVDDVTPVVASKVGSGEFQDITQVRVGNVIDTIRRRKNKLTEVYTTTSVPA